MLNHNVIKRRIQIKNLKALTRSSDWTILNFIVHINDEYDYQFVIESAEKQKELFYAISERYFNIMNKNLLIFEVPGKVGLY